MSLTRRQLLAASPAALALASAPGALLAQVAAHTPAMPDLSQWDQVRAQFVLDPSYLHFSQFLSQAIRHRCAMP